MKYLVVVLGSVLLAASSPAFAQRTEPAAPAQPDNSRANKQDPGPTADQQSGTKEDLQLAQKIRAAITSDKSLSTYAHNVKVIVQNGTVTLRGPVGSATEKQTVESDAKNAAGGAKVSSEITIAAR